MPDTSRFLRVPVEPFDTGVLLTRNPASASTLERLHVAPFAVTTLSALFCDPRTTV